MKGERWGGDGGGEGGYEERSKRGGEDTMGYGWGTRARLTL